MIMKNYLSKYGEKAFRSLVHIEAGDKRLTRRDEKNILQFIQKQLSEADTSLPPIINLELMISQDCNLRCDYCFVQTKRPASMSKETGEKAVEFLIDSSGDQKDIGFLFFGGEPLLGFKTIVHIVDYAEKRAAEVGKKFIFSITTNGTLLTEPVLQFLKEHGVTILLSVDGTPEVHDKHRKTRNGEGSFSLVSRNFDRILEYFPDIELRVTPHPDTANDLLESIRFLVEVGFNRFIIGATHGIKWPGDSFDVYKQQMNEIIMFHQSMLGTEKEFHLFTLERGTVECSFGCRAGAAYAAVAADGSLAPCSMFLGTPGIEETYRFGNVAEGITTEMRRRELLTLNAQRDKACHSCDLVRECGGGCLVTNFKDTGCFVTPSHQQCRDIRVRSEFIRLISDVKNPRCKPVEEVLTNPRTEI